jgi:hypothetical protein
MTDKLLKLPCEEDISEGYLIGEHSRNHLAASIKIPIARYCACIYDGVWCIGMVLDYSIDNDDYQIRFMHQSYLPLHFTWPR